MFSWGIGLRSQHAWDWMEQAQKPVFELLSDNYLYQLGGPAREMIRTLCAEHPPLLHGVGLNIGGLDPMDHTYLQRLRQLAELTRSPIVSDHLCFSRGLGIETYDLFPLPYTPAELRRVSERVNEVQDVLGCRLTLENISSYVAFRENAMTEMEFLLELTARTGCRILLDVNNLYVSCHNLKLDVETELRGIDPDLISYFHVSGHSHRSDCLYDSHDQNVIDPVMQILGRFLEKARGRCVVLERDDARLPFAELLTEWQRLRSFSWDTESPCVEPLHAKRKAPLLSDDCVPRSLPQHQLIQELLQSLHMGVTEMPVAAWLTDATVHRWPLYVQGLVGRWTGLVETTFRRAVHVWGQEPIAGLLLDYARVYPPATGDMNGAFAGLPSFVRGHEAYGRTRGLADFLEACLLYWELLEGRDPLEQDRGLPSLQSLLQSPARCLMPKDDELDLFLLWQRSVDSRFFAEDGDVWPEFFGGRRGIVCVKASTQTVAVLPADVMLEGFYRRLTEGAGLEDAIAGLESVDAHGPLLEDKLAAGLRELGAAGLLVNPG